MREVEGRGPDQSPTSLRREEKTGMLVRERRANGARNAVVRKALESEVREERNRRRRVEEETKKALS